MTEQPKERKRLNINIAVRYYLFCIACNLDSVYNLDERQLYFSEKLVQHRPDGSPDIYSGMFDGSAHRIGRH